MNLLVVNTGSSSLKLRVLDDNNDVLAKHDSAITSDAAHEIESSLGEVAQRVQIEGIGHRVVHGGDRFTNSVRLGASVRREIAALVDLAPLHQPLALAGIDAATRVFPGVPAVACFDTAFHATMALEAATYALPEAWRRDHGIKRYGFHGLSHAYASRRAAELVGGRIEDLRIVTCHLGAGASLAAVVGGRSVDTTMGFTPLEGLVMATRSGSIDPGIPLWLVRQQEMSAEDVQDALEHRSGLVALAGTSDMREVIERAKNGDDGARLALDVYVHRLGASIAAMAASMGGLDAITFTAGVGENAAEVRRRAVERVTFLGAGVDPDANAAATGDADISEHGTHVRTIVVEAREELEVAREVHKVLGTASKVRE